MTWFCRLVVLGLAGWLLLGPVSRAAPAGSAVTALLFTHDGKALLSAGADGFFGNAGGTSAALWGGIWTPQTAATVYPQGSSGYDDQANFTSGLLGAGAD